MNPTLVITKEHALQIQHTSLANVMMFGMEINVNGVSTKQDNIYMVLLTLKSKVLGRSGELVCVDRQKRLYSSAPVQHCWVVQKWRHVRAPNPDPCCG